MADHQIRVGDDTMSLEVTKPQRGSDGKGTVAATVTLGRAGRPLEGRRIQFYLDGRPYGEPKETQNDGNAVCDFTGLEHGTRTIAAQIVGWTDRVRQTVAVEGEKKQEVKLPVKLTVRFQGRRGNWELIITLCDSDGNPVHRAEGFVLDPGKTPTRQSILTDGSGVATYCVQPFTERAHIVEVAFPKLKASWRSVLLGP